MYLFQLQFRADNGDGPIKADFVPDMKNKLCDGMWHKIKGMLSKTSINYVYLDNYCGVLDSRLLNAA